ncbi:hypothetical protein EGH21_06205 [Halomicroarcula sp. F13]|uniref:DUF8173 domain-containing protein n=1 Tax=Haloarcula rubra TaxID=2487747 RepID=A0AAW4PQC8_9EURY|nr:hypothetical protein [Halomicroarcula rubra]MBX0322618.1 hypothetical protein [Halomicroarcula rubra]
MPSTSQRLAAAVAALAVLPGVAAAQQPTGQVTLSPLAQFAAAGGYSLLVGALLLAAAPAWTRNAVDDIFEDPGVVVAVGTLGYLAIIVGLVLLALTLIGLIVTIPGLLALFVVALVGTPLGAYAVGRWLTGVGDVDNRWAALAVGAVVVGAVSAVPVVGDLLNALVASPGIGLLLLRGKASLLD